MQVQDQRVMYTVERGGLRRIAPNQGIWKKVINVRATQQMTMRELTISEDDYEFVCDHCSMIATKCAGVTSKQK